MPDSITRMKEEAGKQAEKEVENRARSKFTDQLEQDLWDDIVRKYDGSIRGSTNWYKDFEFDVETLAEFDQADRYLEWFKDRPKEMIQVIQTALSYLSNPDKWDDNALRTQFILRIKSGMSAIPVRQLDTTKIDQLVILEGTVRAKSELMGRRKWSKWKCFNCGDIRILDIYTNKNGAYCVKCEKGMKLMAQRDTSLYYFKLDDPDSSATGGITRAVNIEVMFGLAESAQYNKLAIGSRIKVTGILERKQKKEAAPEYMFQIECRNIEYIEAKKEIVVTDDDIAEFKKVAKSPTLITDLAQSIAPNIRGYDLPKKGCLLQLAGGVRLMLNGKHEERGNIHILLVSSPGLGKSQLLKRVISFLKGSRFTAGKTVSGVGLVAAMMKDEEIGGWYVSAGAVALASGAIVAIDELDKISKEDLAHMNSAMVDCQTPIDKAGLHVVLDTNTAVLAAANPKNRMFDKREPIWKQIDLQKDFLDRFDLIIPIEAPKTDEENEAIANVVVGKFEENSEEVQPTYSYEFMVKYISYVRQLTPKMTPEIRKYIVANYLKIAKPSDKKDAEDKAYFSFRPLTNIVRMSQAVAKLRMSQKIEVEDAQYAINLLIESLKAQEIITKDNLMDYEKQEAITPKPKRDLMYQVLDVIKEICENHITADGLAEIDEIEKECLMKLHLDSQSVEKTMLKLQQVGDIMQPKPNRYKIN